jgi:outer membrane protein assembly factor BamB
MSEQTYNTMKTSELIFVGIKGSVIALDCASGREAWSSSLKGMDFVNVVLEDGKVLATCCGEIFCLDAISGRVLWHNPLKGYGRGLATMATESNPGNCTWPALAQKHRSDEAASAAAASAAV